MTKKLQASPLGGLKSVRKIRDSIIRTSLQKCFLLLLFLFGSLGISKAQVIVPAGNGGTSLQVFPITGGYNYARVAYIYTAAEIGAGAGTITSLGFYVNSVSSPGSVPVKVYMKSTANTAFSAATTVATEEAGATLVYDATIPASSFVAGTFITLPLSTTFAWNGTSNIEIIVENNTAANETTSGKLYRYITSTDNRVQYWLGSTSGPSAAAGTLTPAFRANTQFGGLVIPTNDLAVQAIYTMGRLPIPAGTPHAVKAVISNNGTVTSSSQSVTLNISGANSFTDTKTVPALAPGASATITFTAFSPTVSGTNAISVTLPTSDDAPANNTQSLNQDVNSTGIFSYVSSPVNTGALASIGSTSALSLGAKFTTSTSRTVTGVNIYVTAAGTITARLYDAAGNILASSAATAVSTGLKSFTFTSPVVIGAGDFMVGGLLSANTRVGFQYEPPTRPATFYQIVGVNNLADLASSNFGKTYIEAVTSDPPACSAVTSLQTPSLTAGTLTATSAQLVFGAGSGAVDYTVTYTPSGGSAVTVSPNQSTSPITISGLTPNTTYTATIRTNCAGGVNSGTPLSVSFTTPLANDLAVNAVYSLGQAPQDFASPHVVQARITNAGSNAQTNIPVTLTITGANSGTLTTNVTLAAGASTVVSFSPGFALTNLGVTNLSVSVPGDDNATNNTGTYTQNVSADRLSYIAPGTALNASSIGVGSANGVIAVKYTLPSASLAAITSVTPTFLSSASTTTTYQILIYDATGAGGTPGNILYTSATQTRTSAASSPVISVPTIDVPANGIFYVAVKELDNNMAIGYQLESPLRSNTFYYKTATSAWTDFTTSTFAARIALEANIIAVPACAVPFGVAVNNTAIGSTSNSGTATVNWNAQTSAVNGYNIRYRQLNTSTWTTVTASGAATSSKVLTGLAVGTEYEVQVEANCDVNGTSGYSASVTFSLPGLPLSYNVSRTTGQAFNSINGSGSPFTWTANGAQPTLNTDENFSEPLSLSNLNFNFFYQGSKMSALRVSINGFLTFNTLNTSTKFSDANNLASAAFGPVLAPFWDDLVTQGDPAATNSATGLATLNSSASPIKYEISGAPGSQKLTIEWSEMETYGNSGPSLTFQVVLYEGSNKIDFNYGNMFGFDGTNNFTYSYSTGINASTVSATPASGEVLSQQIPNANNFSFTAVNNLNWVPECNSKLTFTPAANPVLASDPIATISNQVCSSAIPLTVGSGVSNDFCQVYRSGLNSGETPPTITTACSPALTGNDDDVWFSFTTSQTTNNVVIVNGSGGYNPVVEMYSGNCGSLVAVNCKNATGAGLTETLTNNLLPAGTYYVRVFASGTGAPASSGAFTISTYSTVAPPANDDCNLLAAYELTPGVTCSSTSSGNTANATATAGVPTCNATTPGTADDDVWYSFVAPSNTVWVEVTGNSGYNPVMQILSGSCGALVNAGCFNATGTGGTEAAFFNGNATVGNRYYVRVYHASNGATPTTGFNICITTPVPGCPTLSAPANGATTINPATANTFTWTAPTGVTPASYDLVISTNSNLSSPLVSQNVTTLSYQVPALTFSNSTVYYWSVVSRNVNGTSTNCTTRSFTTTGTVPSCALNMSPATNSANLPLTQTLTWTAGGGVPTGYDIYFGTSQTLVSGKDASVKVRSNTTATTYSPTLANGTTYYWSVIPKNAQGDASGCSVFSFSTVAAPPANDNCSGATTLALSTPVNATSVNATQSSAGCVGNADDDVWFKFTTNNTNTDYTITATGNGSFNPVIQLYGTSCASASVACSNTNATTSEVYNATGLTKGATYYFRVYSFAAGSGTFDIEVKPTINNLTITTNQNVSGTYNNVTVVSGNATVTGPLTVNGNLTVKNGAILTTGTNVVSGGIFTLEAGGKLQIGSTAGITASGSTGNIQFTTRNFNTGADYVYNGSAAQATGSGLPATVRDITINNNSGVNLTNNLNVTRMVTLTRGNLNLGSRSLILVSNASGTAMVVNTNGIVNGTATMQRYVSRGSASTGYRHYASPVVSAPLSQLNDNGFNLIVNPGYNALPTPDSIPINQFPNIFRYNESRLNATFSDFNTGWESPSSTSENMVRGKGYTIRVPRITLDLSGTLNNGTVSAGTLTRGATSESGWHLLGNPYPSPIDWDQITRPSGMMDAVYTFRSDGDFTGQYLSYVNGVGSLTNGVIPAMQGFFVRVTSNVAFSFTNAARLTTYANPSFYRSAAETRPLVQLNLINSKGNADELYVYQEVGATVNDDAAFDAYKVMANGPDVPTLFAITPNGKSLSINGLPVINDETVIPLGLSVAQAGTYSFKAEQLLNIVSSMEVYLEDRIQGTLHNLRTNSTYTVQLSAGSNSSRFALRFKPAGKTVSASQELSQAVVYPNPTSNGQGFALSMSGLKTEKLQALLYNQVGQVVETRTVTVKNGMVAESFNTEKLAKGIYTLKLVTDDYQTAKKVIVQ